MIDFKDLNKFSALKFERNIMSHHPMKVPTSFTFENFLKEKEKGAFDKNIDTIDEKALYRRYCFAINYIRYFDWSPNHKALPLTTAIQSSTSKRSFGPDSSEYVNSLLDMGFFTIEDGRLRMSRGLKFNRDVQRDFRYDPKFHYYFSNDKENLYNTFNCMLDEESKLRIIKTFFFHDVKYAKDLKWGEKVNLILPMTGEPQLLTIDDDLLEQIEIEVNMSMEHNFAHVIGEVKTLELGDMFDKLAGKKLF